MLKIVPYHGSGVLIVVIGGLRYPKLGYIVPAVFLINRIVSNGQNVLKSVLKV